MSVLTESVTAHVASVPAVTPVTSHVKDVMSGLPLWLKRLFSCVICGHAVKVMVNAAPFWASTVPLAHVTDFTLSKDSKASWQASVSTAAAEASIVVLAPLKVKVRRPARVP